MDTLDIKKLCDALGVLADRVELDRGVLVVVVPGPNDRETVLEIVRQHTTHRHVAIELRADTSE